MPLMTKMSNKQLLEKFMQADAHPGAEHHKFTTLSSVPKELRETLEKHPQAKKLLHNLSGKTYVHQAKAMTKDLMKLGRLHQAKSKFGTASTYVNHIFAQEGRKEQTLRQQNIRDIQGQRDAEPKKKPVGFGGAAAGGVVSAFGTSEERGTGWGSAGTAAPSINITTPNTTKTHALLHEGDLEDDETTVAKAAASFTPEEYGVTETNLKPLDQLPQAISKPADWVKAEQEIEEPAID